MRAAARIFGLIGVFAVVAAMAFLLGQRDRDATQGTAILATFAAACFFLWVLLRTQGRLDVDGLTLPGVAGHGEEEEIHLPGPSIYPAFYGGAALLLFLGLVFNYTLLLVGVVALVLTTVGWAVESVRDYRREVAHHTNVELPDPAAIEAGHRVLAFRRQHAGADALVQHLGNGAAEIVLVGDDGTWGTIAVRDVALGRAAVELGGALLHDTWPGELRARVRTDEAHWTRMAGAPPYVAPDGPHGPRDGTTQVAARIFLAIGVFGLVAGVLFFLGQRDRDAVQGTSILMAFAAACAYLFVALRGARGGSADLRFADEHGVAAEPTEPEPPVDLATLHLPGPSIWPAAYGVATGLLMLGLVFNNGIALAGLVLVVLSTIGWALESVREYRASIASGHGASHGANAAEVDHASAAH